MRDKRLLSRLFDKLHLLPNIPGRFTE